MPTAARYESASCVLNHRIPSHLSYALGVDLPSVARVPHQHSPDKNPRDYGHKQTIRSRSRIPWMRVLWRNGIPALVVPLPWPIWRLRFLVRIIRPGRSAIVLVRHVCALVSTTRWLLRAKKLSRLATWLRSPGTTRNNVVGIGDNRV